MHDDILRSFSKSLLYCILCCCAVNLIEVGGHHILQIFHCNGLNTPKLDLNLSNNRAKVLQIGNIICLFTQPNLC